VLRIAKTSVDPSSVTCWLCQLLHVIAESQARLGSWILGSAYLGHFSETIWRWQKLPLTVAESRNGKSCGLGLGPWEGHLLEPVELEILLDDHIVVLEVDVYDVE
jgi:hypothetical protein